MKKSIVGILAAVASVSLAGAAQAQNSAFTIEPRVGLAIPTGDFADLWGVGAELNTGFGASVNVGYDFTPMIGAYAGFSYNTFAVDVDDEDVSINDTGFDAGIRAQFAGIGGGLSPFLKGGIVYHQLEASDDEAEVELGDQEIGFEIGGGLSFPLGPRISVTPGASYVMFSPEEDADVSYVKVDVGLRIRL